MLTFVEDSLFTRDRPGILDENEYLNLQVWLAGHPEAGDVIRASGGCRKIRWAAKGHGKSGGARVIYFYRVSASTILMLRIYPKNKKSDLTPKEIGVIRKIVT